MHSNLNLCDLITSDVVDDDAFWQTLTADADADAAAQRVYVGSYFCNRYFLTVDWSTVMTRLTARGAKATLVVPIFNERSLADGKTAIRRILTEKAGRIDEVVANDFGMVLWLYSEFIEKGAELKLHLGRALFREPRDPRVPEYANGRFRLSRKHLLDNLPKLHCGGVPEIAAIELDEICSEIVCDEEPNAPPLVVHEPFCYITTGRVCKFGSAGFEIQSKFRPDPSCKMECSRCFERSEKTVGDAKIVYCRIGRTVYSYSEKRSEIQGAPIRRVYFPFLELLEHLRSAK